MLSVRPLAPSELPDFLAVGSEVARLRAGHRPPLKLYVQFSRIQLSRRLTLPRCNRRDQLNQVHQPVLAVQLGFRQLSPATVSPSLESMRPNAPHNPAVEPVEELSDVGSLVVMAPSPQHRVQFLNQLFGLERHTSTGKRAYLIHETADLPRLILYPRNSNPCRTCTIRVFCGCSCTPNSFRIRSAPATASRASAADS